MKNFPVYGIIGPTASGKTALGKNLVDSANFVIINADSQQIYSYLPHLSCIPTQLYQNVVNRHMLYGIIDSPKVRFNAVYWAKLVHKEIELAQKANKIPVLLGGTGMYFNVLKNGIAPLVEIDDNVKEFVKSLSWEALLEKVSKQEAEKFKDRMRLEKAAAIFLQTNEHIEQLKSKAEPEFKLENFKIYALLPTRDTVWGNIEKRLNLQLDNMINDVINFNRANKVHYAAEGADYRDYGADKFKISMIGYKEINNYLKHGNALDALKQELFQKTRQYAKRQATYIRNCLEIERVFQDADQLFEEICKVSEPR